ncbi:MAG TPA: hypothetical protein VE439_11260 [Anaerolineae bacterium]|jgi:serine/threonine-protein kinase RsbW|nr:hypothetical protein [Anaerolineae bacterium]
MYDVDRIEISLPARKEYARLLRLAAAGISSRMNFSFDGLEDLKIGLDEAYLLAINDPEQRNFDVVFEVYGDRLEVLVTGLGSAETLEEELSQKFGFSILNSVMDKVEWTRVDEAKRNLRMTKNIR